MEIEVVVIPEQQKMSNRWLIPVKSLVPILVITTN